MSETGLSIFYWACYGWICVGFLTIAIPAIRELSKMFKKDE